MKLSHMFLAGAAALATAACNGEQAGNGGSTTAANSGPVSTVQRPASGDWSEAVVATLETAELQPPDLHACRPFSSISRR